MYAIEREVVAQETRWYWTGKKWAKDAGKALAGCLVETEEEMRRLFHGKPDTYFRENRFAIVWLEKHGYNSVSVHAV